MTWLFKASWLHGLVQSGISVEISERQLPIATFHEVAAALTGMTGSILESACRHEIDESHGDVKEHKIFWWCWSWKSELS